MGNIHAEVEIERNGKVMLRLNGYPVLQGKTELLQEMMERGGIVLVKLGLDE